MTKHGTPVEVAFMAKVRPVGACLEWQAALSTTGYGVFRGRSAHRTAYELFVGPVDLGMDVDHICRNRRCVDPRHLQVVTHRENSLSSTSPMALNAAKTHCKRGHEFTPENTERATNGRACRTCRQTRAWEAA